MLNILLDGISGVTMWEVYFTLEDGRANKNISVSHESRTILFQHVLLRSQFDYCVDFQSDKCNNVY